MKDQLTILTGDNRALLPTLEAGSVHCCVTSPPYYGLRDYGTGEWQGGDPGCEHAVRELRRGLGLATSTASTRGGGHKAAEVENIKAQGTCPHCGAIRVDNQIGQEPSPEEYVDALVQVFREVRRVLRDDGTLWLNLGDSYANDTKWGGKTSGKHAKALHEDGSIGRCRHLTGLPGKNLMGIPWRVALALQADGWILRQDIIWSKPNPMPESVTDRCTKAHEYLFHFSKSPRYYFDAEAIAEPSTYAPGCGWDNEVKGAFDGVRSDADNRTIEQAFRAIKETRNKRSVWTVPTVPYKKAHFATFPPNLIKPCILAGCPTSGTHCDCEEVIETPTGDGGEDDPSAVVGRAGMSRPRGENGGVRSITRRQQRSDAEQMKRSPHRETMEKLCSYQAFEHYIRTDLAGARPLPDDLRQEFLAEGWLIEAAPCSCETQPAGIVLDPFGGSGTTGMVALELGRRAILCELNPEYRPLMDERCNITPGFDFSFNADPELALFQ